MRPPAILADDLTGALDTAAQMTGRWGMVPVWPNIPDRPLLPPVALNSGTRDLSEPAAVRRSIEAAGALAGGVTYKKIDSLLRGSWAAELAGLWQVLGFERCVLAPAFPAQGRVTLDGWHMAPDWSPIDLVSGLRAVGLLTDPEGPIVLKDAIKETDLMAIVTAEAESKPLWCGSAGLARAVAGVPARLVALDNVRSITIIGSDHPVSRTQVAALSDFASDVVTFLRPGDESARRDLIRRLRDVTCSSIAITFDFAPGISRDEASSLAETELQLLLPHSSIPRRLVVVGGATLEAVLRSLDVSHLICIGEAAPGLPVSHLVGGKWDGVELVSKSGAFGSPNALVEINACYRAGSL